MCGEAGVTGAGSSQGVRGVAGQIQILTGLCSEEMFSLGHPMRHLQVLKGMGFVP